MDSSVEDYILKRIANNSIKSLSVSWYGGEPLLSVPTIKRLSKVFLKVNKYNAILFTNGYSFDDLLIDSLPELGIDVVHITIDGERDVHNKNRLLKDGSGTYDTILNNTLKILEKHGDRLYLNIRKNIDAYNINSVKGLLGEFVNYKNKNLRISIHPLVKPLTGIGKDYCGAVESEEFERAFVQIQDYLLLNRFLKPYQLIPKFLNFHNCFVNFINGFSIGPDGKIYKCFGDIHPSQHSIGMINDSGEIDLKQNKLNVWQKYNSFELSNVQNVFLYQFVWEDAQKDVWVLLMAFQVAIKRK